MGKKVKHVRIQHVKKKDPPWTPFEKAVGSWSAVPVDRRAMVDAGMLPELTAMYVNSRYTVSVSKRFSKEFDVEITHLDIRRNDKDAIHDWRDLQRIKNELCGPEWEGIELYPKESRLVDSANSYHLYVFPEGSIIPVGWTERLVMEGIDEHRPGFARQRPWDDDDSRPKDLKTEKEALAEIQDQLKKRQST